MSRPQRPGPGAVGLGRIHSNIKSAVFNLFEEVLLKLYPSVYVQSSSYSSSILLQFHQAGS